jgi:anti-sigma B factor antagonist
MSDVNTQTSFDVRSPDERVGIVAVNGELTATAEEGLMEAYHRASDAETRAVVLDFTGLEYMNSTGIGLLVTLLVRAQRQRQRLLAFGLNDHYRQIFALTRLDEAITIADSEEDALAAAA